MGKSPLNIQLQSRDLELLAGLLDARLMTFDHAAALHFDGSREAAKKRIQKLRIAGFVGVRERKAYEPVIIHLSRAGFLLLQREGKLQHLPQLSWPMLDKRLRVSQLTLRHELDVLTTKAAFTTAIRNNKKLQITEFSTWPMLHQFMANAGNGPDVLVKPDGFLRVREEDEEGVFEHILYLEVDRSSETLEALARRARCYLNFYQRGGLAQRFGRPREEYKDFPFRVLMIFRTAERRDNMAECLLAGNPPIYTQVWLSTFDEVAADPLTVIWVQPKDYATAAAGVPSNSGAQSVYRRDVRRQLALEATLIKRLLFES